MSRVQILPAPPPVNSIKGLIRDVRAHFDLNLNEIQVSKGFDASRACPSNIIRIETAY